MLQSYFLCYLVLNIGTFMQFCWNNIADRI
jgi:hypothetical protein